MNAEFPPTGGRKLGINKIHDAALRRNHPSASVTAGRSLWPVEAARCTSSLGTALYSKNCYSLSMSDKSTVLREIMLTTGTTQSELSRLSGVWQPSISQFLSRKVQLSDEQLDRLLSCMGYRLEIVRRPVRPELTRSEWRSWRLHRQLSTHLTESSIGQWRSTIERNLERLRGAVQGQPHVRNLDRWEILVERSDVAGLHRIFTGLDRDSIEMREVSPVGGLLPNEERLEALQLTS
jgi:transcriptional regulator with XRE-family HTH domain